MSESVKVRDSYSVEEAKASVTSCHNMSKRLKPSGALGGKKEDERQQENKRGRPCGSTTELHYSSSGGGTADLKVKPAEPAVSSYVSMKSDGSKGNPPNFCGEGREPSCVSMKSDGSKGNPPNFSGEGREPSCASMKSDRSKGNPPNFSGEEREPSCASMKSDQSKGNPPNFSGEGREPSCASMKSDRSKGNPPNFSGEGREPSCASMKSDRSKGNPSNFSGEGKEPSCASMKSDRSKGNPPNFSGEEREPSCVSMKSDRSKGNPPNFSGEGREPSCVSMKSDMSKGNPPNFSGEGREPSCVSMNCDMSKGNPPNFSGEVREPSCASMKSDMSKGNPPNFSGGAAPSNPEQCSSADLNTHTLVGGTGPLQQDTHQPVNSDLHTVLEKHKTSMKNKHESLFQGIKTPENRTLLNRIYTQLYIIEGESEGVNKEHEVLQMEKTLRNPLQKTPINCSDIFKPLQGHKDIRTVLTKGIAGIGKTVSVQKFILDWAEGKANQDLDFMFVLPFRELNLIKDHQYSLQELLCVFHPELKGLDPKIFLEHNIVFIFDGLDESRIPLNFFETNRLSDVTNTSSVGVLMTNLLKGELLPSALIWITCRPAAAYQIPFQYISHVTEIQGFNDPQKEEYFRKSISDQDQAQKIISHIKTVRSLHIMCYIPIFCWISATVLQHIFKQGYGKIPKTLTEMYSHFLITQVHIKKEKYEEKDERDTEKLLESNRADFLKMAELAYKQLIKRNVIFYEEDLRESGIDNTEALVYSGVFTEILREEYMLYKKVYCFIHLSFQEFLAAVYVFYCFETQNMKVLQSFKKQSLARLYDCFYDSCGMCYNSDTDSEDSVDSSNSETCHRTGQFQSVSLDAVLMGAVCKAVCSRSGHLYLFLRFLLGISLESNQRLLHGLLKEINTHSKKITKYIKNLIKGKENDLVCQSISMNTAINLFLCLSELNDHPLSSEIQEYLKSEKHSKVKLSPGECSALACMLLTSEEVLEELNLKEYNTTEKGYENLLPAVTTYRRAILDGCNLTKKHCEVLSVVLQSVNWLKELDLSNNDVQDSGVGWLSDGLKSSHCKLEILRLSGCMITEKGCSFLASALKSYPSNLRELDLFYNHPGETGVKLLSEQLKDPQCKLETFYFCKLTLDPNTISTVLSLSEGNRKVECLTEEQLYPDHPERFICWDQVLSVESLTGHCYWEVEWSGQRRPVVAVSYRGIRRRGFSENCLFGRSNQSWSLEYINDSYCVYHNNYKIAELHNSHHVERLGVYEDCQAGILSFYTISPLTRRRTLLHTLHTTFTEPLCAGFRVFKSVCFVELE